MLPPSPLRCEPFRLDPDGLRDHAEQERLREHGTGTPHQNFELLADRLLVRQRDAIMRRGAVREEGARPPPARRDSIA